MTVQFAASPSAQRAFGLVKDLQAHLIQQLETLPPAAKDARFRPVEWQRAQGAFGGGTRFVAIDEALFNRASANISQVQYEKDATRKLGSASALSSIVHPRHPLAPSMHIHISWTEMKDGSGYWRIMGDLNPSNPNEVDKADFQKALEAAAGKLYEAGAAQGDRYFHIPALGRHRGVAHFYLEDYRTPDAAADYQFARNFGMRVIDAYVAIVARALAKPFTPAETRRQLDYHTLYFLQVITLDRGTTSGLLVHDENDAGILGSLPSHVDAALLQSWIPKLQPLHQDLLQAILSVLPKGASSLVDDAVKVKIAQVTREFYQKHPEAQDLLARGDVIPPTQTNHAGR